MVSKWKQKRIEKLWDDGWSVGAICKKVNVTKHIVYQYTGRIPITKIKERRLKLSEDYLPRALKKRLEQERTMTSDTFKKIGDENFDDGSPTMTMYIENIQEEVKNMNKKISHVEIYYEDSSMEKVENQETEAIEFTKEEKEWILNEIACSIDSVRGDGHHDDGITFDRKSFDVGDFVKYKINMLSGLHDKLKK